MEKKYKVIALSVGGRGNKIFKAGDVVTAADFPDDNADKLVDQGFLMVIDEEPGVKPVSEETISHIVNETDMDLNPELAEQGVKVGDEVLLSKESDLTPEEEAEARKELEEKLADKKAKAEETKPAAKKPSGKK